MLWNNYRYKIAEDDTVHILQYQGEELTVKHPGADRWLPGYGNWSRSVFGIWHGDRDH